MAKARLDEIWDAVRTLTPEELRQLLVMLKTTTREHPCDRTGSNIGDELLDDEPMSPMNAEEFRAYQPIEVSGEPLSETIIRERR